MPVATSAAEAPPLSKPLLHAAQIEAMVQVCREEAPNVSAHLNAAYQDWFDRNPEIVEARHGLHFGPGPEARTQRRHAYEARAHAIAHELRLELAKDPANFSERCNVFTKDLDAGRLDYRK